MRPIHLLPRFPPVRRHPQSQSNRASIAALRHRAYRRRIINPGHSHVAHIQASARQHPFRQIHRAPFLLGNTALKQPRPCRRKHHIIIHPQHRQDRICPKLRPRWYRHQKRGHHTRARNRATLSRFATDPLPHVTQPPPHLAWPLRSAVSAATHPFPFHQHLPLIGALPSTSTLPSLRALAPEHMSCAFVRNLSLFTDSSSALVVAAFAPLPSPTPPRPSETVPPLRRPALSAHPSPHTSTPAHYPPDVALLLETL